jgi:anaerobic selenocysteine-containing dehydrogenase
MFNSWLNDGSTSRGRTDNPAFLHPDELARLGLSAGDTVEIESAHGAIRATVEADHDLIPGLVSMSHGYGAIDEHGTPVADHRDAGVSIQRLLAVTDHADRYSGMPRMSNVPVRLTRIAGVGG